jgi:hypothetical protein
VNLQEIYLSRNLFSGVLMQARFDYEGGSNVVYAGFAPSGKGEGEAFWVISKFTYDVNDNITAAQMAPKGSNWTARGGYTYT